MEMASLDDFLEMEGLAEPVRVARMMDIRNEILCYEY